MVHVGSRLNGYSVKGRLINLIQGSSQIFDPFTNILRLQHNKCSRFFLFRLLSHQM